MNQYLIRTAEKLHTGAFAASTLIVGNESCDLDSAVCALVLGFYLQHQHNIQRDLTDGSGRKIFVPLLNVLKKDFPLKTEVSFTLREKNIPTDYLFYRDLDIEKLMDIREMNVILVDHHILAKRDEILAEKVEQIIDHRPVDASTWPYKQDVEKTIALVGSCSTLICDKIKNSDPTFFHSNHMCAELLLETIILDTVNFSSDVKKGTPKDEEMVVYLEGVLGITDTALNRSNIFSKLVRARKDVSRLTSAELLRKDVKIVGNIYIPSFPVPVKDFLKMDNVVSALKETLEARQCTMAVLLGMKIGAGAVERDLGIYSCPVNRERTDKLIMMLTAILQLQEEESGISDVAYFRQLNLAASRKQVMPIVNDFLKP